MTRRGPQLLTPPPRVRPSPQPSEALMASDHMTGMGIGCITEVSAAADGADRPVRDDPLAPGMGQIGSSNPSLFGNAIDKKLEHAR